MSLVNLSFPVTSDRANLPRLNWLTFRPKPMIYLRWLGSNPGGFIEIKRELTLWRAKQQPKFGLSERKRWAAEVRSFRKGGTEQNRGCCAPRGWMPYGCAPVPSFTGLAPNSSCFPV